MFRAYRYGVDYPGLAGKTLTAGKSVAELDDEAEKIRREQEDARAKAEEAKAAAEQAAGEKTEE